MIAAPRVAKSFVYVDENARPIARVDRIEPGRDGRRKDFLPYLVLPSGEFAIRPGLGGRALPLYCLDEVLAAARAAQPVFVVEGEGKADVLREQLRRAKSAAAVTTLSGGAGRAMSDADAQALRGAPRIYVLPDADPPGRACATARADVILRNVPDAEVRIVDLFPLRDDGSDVADWLDEGRDLRELYALATASDPIVAPVTLPAGDDAPAAPAPRRLRLTRADRVPMRRIEWLAPNRIPFGGITLFDGPGGVGKTTFLLGVIAAASRGVDFFTGKPIAPCASLIVGVEDQRALIVARLRLYGADLTHLHFVDAAQVSGGEAPFVLPDHCAALAHAVDEQQARLVYVDALFSHLAMDGDGRMAQQVRAALAPVAAMCEAAGCALIAVRHWSKAAGPAAARALGSTEFTNVARSVFSFGPDPGGDGTVLAAGKSNYAAATGSLRFRLVAHELEDDAGEPWAVSIAELAGESDVSADDLAMRLPTDPDEKQAATAWLRDHLADGEERSRTDVVDAARRANAGSPRTIERAASDLNVIRSRSATFPSVATWRLPPPDSQLRHSCATTQCNGTTGETKLDDDGKTLYPRGFSSCATSCATEVPPDPCGATGSLASSELEPSNTSEPEFADDGAAARDLDGLPDDLDLAVDL